MKRLLVILVLAVVLPGLLVSQVGRANPGILYIYDDITGGDCTSVGEWDPDTKTCTLNQDLTETIQVEADGITLDGNGHSIIVGKTTGNYDEAGVFIPYHSGVTVKNLVVSDTTYGIHASSYYTTLTISNVMITGDTYGISIWASSGVIIENSTFFDNGWGIWVHQCADWGVVRGNTFTNAGLAIESAPGGEFRENYIDGMFYLAHSGDSLAVNNTLVNGGLVLFNSPDNLIYNNNFINSSYNNVPSPYMDADSVSTFSMDAPTGGNYWSNYDQPDEGCLDENGDHFCDAPYIFSNGQDDLPWTGPDEWLVRSVDIDIKPGSEQNTINLKSNGVIPVAILTTGDFDATTVDPLSVEFGPNGATETHGKGHSEDVDGDGDIDLVLHFETQDTGIQCGDTSATLTGMTFSGGAITGSDSIITIGCK